MDEYVRTMVVEWYAVINDLIGGWALSTTDEPVSSGSGLYIGDFMCEDTARHIAAVHNTCLYSARSLVGGFNGSVPSHEV